jgi:hypothetical protein
MNAWSKFGLLLQASYRTCEHCGRRWLWAILLVYVERTFDEWKAQAEMPEYDRTPYAVAIVVDDTFEDGIRDTTEISFIGLPIRMADNGEWVGGCGIVPELIVGRAVRTYPDLSDRNRIARE